MDFLQTKQHFGQDLLGPQTKFDIDLCMTLTVNVKLLYSAKSVTPFLVMDIFD